MTTPGEGRLIGHRLGAYELQQLLGVGGMAEVYRARDLELGREVAVKVLPASLATDREYVERFRNEARQVGTLSHPHIVPVYYFATQDELLYLVMPILPQSLRDRLEAAGTLEPAEAARIVGQIASALEAAHENGLVHRDVKPENILLNEEGEALLSDFGIARRISLARQGQTLSATGLPVGTPEYMAPEQLLGQLVDQRADVYALGTVLYEVLTGTVPHEADTPYAVASEVLNSPVEPPSKRNPVIWPELEAVVLTALAFRADDRYQNMRTFAAALRQGLHPPGKGLLTGPLRAPVASAPLPEAITRNLSILPTVPAAGSPVSAAADALLAGTASATALAANQAPPAGASALNLVETPQLAPAATRVTKTTTGGARLTLPSMPAVRAVSAVATVDAPTLVDVPRVATRFPDRNPALNASRRRWLAVAGVVALLLLASGSLLAVSAQLGGSTVRGQRPLQGQDIAAAAATSTAVSSPGSTVPPVGSVTLTATPQATATATPGRSATPTAVPVPPLSLSAVTWPKRGFACSGTQTIATSSGSMPDWRWESISPDVPPGFTYQVNGSQPAGGLPHHEHPTATSKSDTLTVTFIPCNNGQAYQVTLLDSLGNRYHFGMTLPQGTGGAGG